jgi:hypothetical protein
MDLQEMFSGVMPIFEKASPRIAKIIGHKNIVVLVGLLGVIFDCDPTDKEKLKTKLDSDIDLYAKIKNLESTHGYWLSSLS